MGRARGKSCLQYIDNKRKRRATFANRKKGLQKKTHELATLCDVEACLICCGSDGEFETWPPEKTKVVETIARYRNQERGKKKVKTAEGVHPKVLFPTWDEKLDRLSEERLLELRNLAEIKLAEVQQRIELIKLNNHHESSGRCGCVNEAEKSVDHQAGNVPYNYFGGDENNNLVYGMGCDQIQTYVPFPFPGDAVGETSRGFDQIETYLPFAGATAGENSMGFDPVLLDEWMQRPVSLDAMPLSLMYPMDQDNFFNYVSSSDVGFVPNGSIH